MPHGKSKTKIKKLPLLVIIALLLVATTVVLEATNTTHFFHKAATVSAPGTPLTKVPVPAPAPAVKNPGNPSGSEKGGPTELNSPPAAAVSSNPDEWSTSASRLITVKAPLRQATLKSGDSIVGATHVADQIQYRLIDDQTGVISEGPINVTNGTFAAAISFVHHGTTGRLDVFNTADGGREINEVQIAVAFE